MILIIPEIHLTRKLQEGEIITVGRKGFGADIEIDHDHLSRLHAQIRLDHGEVKILDNNSTNGIVCNGQKLQPKVWYTVTPADQLSMVGHRLQFQQTGAVAPEPGKSVNTDNGNNGQDSEAAINNRFKELIRHRLPVKIGRHPSNEIVLPDKTGHDKIVSRIHAEIFYRNGSYWVQDLGSTNFTFVNGLQLLPNQPRAITSNDRVLIHIHSFNIVEGYRDLRNEPAILARGLGKSYGTFVGLQPMDFEIPNNQIVALMGPSGCGKSTLLKALNGDNPATSGEVLIHGLPLRQNFQFLKKKIGYVPQDDTIHKELTVNRALYLAAKLRLPDHTTDEAIFTRVDEVLSGLNFDAHLRTRKVEKLSGGQRKRVCIAVELLSRPTILFLDEPTSPLDPESIKEFLDSLHKLARDGTTIVMVTHKPADLFYVDKLIFLAAKGYLVYYGQEKGLLQKFNTDNILKVYQVCSNENFKPETHYIPPQAGPVQTPPPDPGGVVQQHNLLLQLYWLTRRYLEIKASDRYNLCLLLAQPFIIAGLISLIFHQLNVQVMMLIAISAIWFGVSNASKEIVGEFAIYKRERMFNLSIHSYVLSKLMVLSLVSLVQVLLFMGILYLRFKDTGVLGPFTSNVAFMFLIASASSLFGLFLSSYYSSTEKVLTVVPIALMPQIMLAGVVEHIRSIKVDVLSFFTFGRWGAEGFLRLQDATIYTPVTTAPFRVPALQELYYNEALNKKGEELVNLFNSLQGNIFAIVLMAVILYCLTYASLKQKDTL